MRLLLFAVAVVVVVAGRTAAADPAGAAAGPATAEPIYPESVVDRPLLLLRGMTTLDLGLDFRTYLQTTVDANGNTATSKTSLWDDHAGDIVVTHSFGSFEIGGRLLGNKTGPFLQAHLRTYLGPIPGALTITADIKATQENSAFDHEYFEDVGYTYKAVVVSHQLALYGNANVEITEVAFKPAAMS